MGAGQDLFRFVIEADGAETGIGAGGAGGLGLWLFELGHDVEQLVDLGQG